MYLETTVTNNRNYAMQELAHPHFGMRKKSAIVNIQRDSIVVEVRYGSTI
jgi:hypothetical protein